jgi:hypothetical protein
MRGGEAASKRRRVEIDQKRTNQPIIKLIQQAKGMGSDRG